MGDLKNHDLEPYIRRCGLTSFAETGLYKGDGLKYAAGFSFTTLVSIDIESEWYELGLKMFKDDYRVHLLLGDTSSSMEEIIAVLDGPTLWWLDAHLPESHIISGRPVFDGNKKYGGVTTFPLESELRSIGELRDFSGDVFIIDDLRIYEDADYRWGPWKKEEKAKYTDPGSSSFIDDILGETHNIERSLNDHGYAVAEPK
jgi:hypothetical protein